MRIIAFAMLLLFPVFSWGQGFSGGVRIGLNFNQFLSPSEVDDAGQDLESFSGNTGFLIGGAANYSFNKYFGVRGEVLFSQKGGRRFYDGQSEQIFNAGTDNEVIAVGTRKAVVRVTNSYIDIPIQVYVAPITKIRIYGGINFGFLVGSTGFGELTYSGFSTNNQTKIEFTSELDYNYLKDEGSAATVNESEKTTFNAAGTEVVIPAKVGAYELDYASREDAIFNRVEIGALGGLAYYLNSSLFVSAIANISLNDLTNDALDLSYSNLADNERVFNADKDQHLSIQVSIGFQF